MDSTLFIIIWILATATFLGGYFLGRFHAIEKVLDKPEKDIDPTPSPIPDEMVGLEPFKQDPVIEPVKGGAIQRPDAEDIARKNDPRKAAEDDAMSEAIEAMMTSPNSGVSKHKPKSVKLASFLF